MSEEKRMARVHTRDAGDHFSCDALFVVTPEEPVDRITWLVKDLECGEHKDDFGRRKG